MPNFNNMDRPTIDKREVDMQEARMCAWVDTKFRDAKNAKTPYEKLWTEELEAYNGYAYTKRDKPVYKADHISNYIFKTIETIRPIMIDNNPNFQAQATNRDGLKKASAIQTALAYEYEREEMPSKLPASIVHLLTIGNAFYYMRWDGKDKKVGNVKVEPISAFNIFPDPMATSIDNAEYLIYAKYMHVNKVKELFPQRADKITAEQIKYEELMPETSRGTNQTNRVLVLKMFLHDYTYVDAEEEIDGVIKIRRTRKYPKGRIITVLPSVNVVLEDKENIYNDMPIPFIHFKNYEMPFEMWGVGEAQQLLSPQKYMNDLSNQIIDNARLTTNPIWILDKNCGIAKGVLTNRAGLIVRKTPGTEVRREMPPSMPQYVFQKVEEFKDDIENISGVHDASSGKRPAGIQAGNAIMALQEAGQTRIRLKVKMLEFSLGKLGTEWYKLMQQFWTVDRFVRVTDETGKVRFEEIKSDLLDNNYDIKVTAGSTMPTNKSAKLDFMIRLAQTMGEDGLPMVDRQTVMQFVDVPDKQGILERMKKIKEEAPTQAEAVQQEMEGKFQELTGAVQELSKVINEMNGDIQRVEQDHEKMKEQERMEQAKEQGYKKGLNEIPPDLDDPQKMMMSMQRDTNIQNQIENGIIPEEALDEILNMSDEELKELFAQYPQLEEMIQAELAGQGQGGGQTSGTPTPQIPQVGGVV